MKTEKKIFTHLDWLTVFMYASLVIFGWFNIYSVEYNGGGMLSLSSSAGKQLVWIGITMVIFIIVMLIHTEFYEVLAYKFYFLAMLLLIGTLIFGIKVGGHYAWYQLGKTQFQPSEFAKFACALAVAKYLSKKNVKLTQLSYQLGLLLLIVSPMLLIILQGDVGSSLVFLAFIILFYKEDGPVALIYIGLLAIAIFVLTLLVSQTTLIIGISSIAVLAIGFYRKSFKKIIMIIIASVMVMGFIEGTSLFITKILKPYQQNRIKALVNPDIDPLGIGWNVTQSKIAIGSGGFWGKGFLQGTQTKFGFVPEQNTDFIFCTIGEEHGWVGSLIVISIFIGLLSRIIYLANRQHSYFANIYGYAIASIIFFHFMVNIGMTIGLMPIIGIPLPFISYGGSALCMFSAMLFVLLKFDMDKTTYLSG